MAALADGVERKTPFHPVNFVATPQEGNFLTAIYLVTNAASRLQRGGFFNGLILKSLAEILHSPFSILHYLLGAQCYYGVFFGRHA